MEAGVEAGGNAIAKRPAFNSAVSACLGDTNQKEDDPASHNKNPDRQGSQLTPRNCIQAACGDAPV